MQHFACSTAGGCHFEVVTRHGLDSQRLEPDEDDTGSQRLVHDQTGPYQSQLKNHSNMTNIDQNYYQQEGPDFELISAPKIG